MNIKRGVLPLFLTGTLFSLILSVHAAPEVPTGKEDKISAQNLSSPRYYDLFWQKKERIYLTGVWQFKLDWNYLSPQWIKANLKPGKTGKGKGLVIKPGKKVPYKEIQFKPEYCKPQISGKWWSLLVPSAWNDQMPYEKKNSRPGVTWVKKNYAMGGIGYYRKKFILPQKYKGQRQVIFFENVETECVVWVNGKEVARHSNWDSQGSGRVAGAFLDYFSAEITDAVKYGSENVVVVGVYDSGLPFAWNTPDTGGITGNAWIENHPNAYFSKTLVRAPYKAEKVIIDAKPAVNSKMPEKYLVEISPWQSEFYKFPGKNSKSFTIEVGAQKSPRTGYRRLVVPVKGLAAWDVLEPNLYELKVIDPRNNGIMALERFGVRTIKTAGKLFLLNDKPIYFFGMNVGNSLLGEGWSHGPAVTNKYGYNFANAARDFILAKRASNFTSQRIHTGPNHRNAYYFCDEAGLMVREEFTPARIVDAIGSEMTNKTPDFEGSYVLQQFFSKDGKHFSKFLQSKLQQFIDYTYNSPCVVTWSGGNEMAAGDLQARQYCTLFYNYMHKNDPQKRPATSSSGMHWGMGHNKKIAWLPLPSDYLDFHSYLISQTRLMPLAVKGFNKEYHELINRVYSGKKYPTILGEFFNQVPTQERLTRFVPEIFNKDGNPDPEAYADFLNNEILPSQKRFRHKRTARENAAFAGVSSIRALRDRETAGMLRGLYLKRGLEATRRGCPEISGYSIHSLNSNWAYRTQKAAPDGSFKFVSPEMEYLRLVQQPLIAIPDFWLKNMVAGQTMSFSSWVINWSKSEFTGDLKIDLVNKAGKSIASIVKPVKTLAISKHADFSIKLKIPVNTPDGVYEMRSKLVSSGKCASENTHRVTVLSPVNFKPVVSSKKIAIYDKQGAKGETVKMLDSFKVKYTLLRSLTKLNGYDVVIIGKNSCDQNAFESAQILRDYMAGGGRLLVFSQQAANPVPWARALKFIASGPAPNADPINMNSPLLKGMDAMDFQSWGKNRVVYNGLLAPVASNVIVAGAATGCQLQSFPVFGMLLTQYKIGKGACLMSQLSLADNYQSDGMAKLLLRNILHYALETPWSTDKIKPLACDDGKVFALKLPPRNKVFTYYLKKVANRTKRNAPVDAWYCKGSECDDLPPGTKLYERMLFRISRKGETIILGNSPGRKEKLPLTITVPLHNMRFAKVYLLHAAAWFKCKPGDKFGSLEWIYTDGSKREVPIIGGKDIADWHKPKSLKNGEIAFRAKSSKGLYLSEFVNPNPRKKLKEMRLSVESGKGYWVTKGVTLIKR